MNSDFKNISIYYDYIKSNLPDYVPNEVVELCLSNNTYSSYTRGLNYYVYYDPGKAPAELAYVASDEEDLKHRIFEDVTYDIARYVQSLNIEQYTNQDFEKLVREYHLNLLKSKLSQGELNLKIKRYENELNQYKSIPQWKFDKDKFEFVKISN